VLEAQNSEGEFGQQIQCIEGRGGLPEINMQFGDATLNLCLQGAHITSYKPDGKTELLWMSQSANFHSEKPIRGGIPLCWPWFGGHLEDSNEPQHGYARTSRFEIVSGNSDGGSTAIVLRLNPEESLRQEKQTGLRMEFEIRLSDQLWMEIKTTNVGDKPIRVGAALHTYFQVSDVGCIKIPQIQGLQYKDKIRNFRTFTQSEPLFVTAETDRVYLSPSEKVNLIDPGFERELSIQTWGNTDLVVWNPWIENARAMADFDNEGYSSMICIEPANALENKVKLEPGQQFWLGKSISLA